MKHFLFLCLAVLCLRSTWAKTEDLRSKIGSTFSSPVAYGDKFYFVATTGVLFEADKTFSTVSKLYEGKRQTIGSLTLSGDRLYWGDGLHTDQKATLHVWDLKKKSLVKDLDLPGHIERAPLLREGLLLVPVGPAGIVALDAQTLAQKWKAEAFEGMKLHVDSNLVSVGQKVCATTVYESKGIVCVTFKTGKITQLSRLTRDPKSEITLWKDHVVGFATEGDLTKPKWDVPADLFIYDVSGDKIKMSKELRGFNFFAPLITGDEAFITLSTGDFILVGLSDGKIQFLGEFPEPFTNNAFIKGEELCGIGIMGKYMCYGVAKNGYALTTDKRLMETVIGKVSVENSKVLAPTRVGYYVE